MSRKIKKIWSVVTTLIVLGAIILAMLMAGVRIFGLRIFTVLSGSMEPTYHTGSLIYVKKTDPLKLETGDVITYMLDENTVVTHRIAGIVPDEEDHASVRFRTKGDANDTEDGTLVHSKNVLGEPVFTIPALGYVAEYVQHPPGIYVTVALGALIMLLMFLPELISALKDGAERGGASKEEYIKKINKKSERKTRYSRRGQIAQPGRHSALPDRRECTRAAAGSERKGSRKKGRHEA